ncbi:MAG: DUF3187 family protein [Planctomycetes bacterium]|nr:DUF3187 family protein [Planctomycetota bacterium]
MIKSYICLVIFLLLIIFPALYAEDVDNNQYPFCSDNVGYGPLNLSSQSPLQLLRIPIRPDSPSTLLRGRKEILTTITWSNLWMIKENRFIVDAEIIRLLTEFNYGLTDRWQIGVEIPVTCVTGGIMDGLAENTHNILNIGQHKRTDYPRNRVKIELLNKTDNTYFTETNKTLTIDDIICCAKYKLTCGNIMAPACAVSLSVKLPTGNTRLPLSGHGVDAGLSFSVSKQWSGFNLYGGLGYSYYGEETMGGIELRRGQNSFWVAGEYRIARKASLITQYLANTGGAKYFYDFSDTSHEITFGMKYQVSSRHLLEFGVLENLINFDNSPDIGFHFGLLSRF